MTAFTEELVLEELALREFPFHYLLSKEENHRDEVLEDAKSCFGENVRVKTRHFSKERGGAYTDYGTQRDFGTSVEIYLMDGENNPCCVGESVCHPKDKPDKKFGRRLAYYRAKESLLKNISNSKSKYFGDLSVGDIFITQDNDLGTALCIKISDNQSDRFNAFRLQGGMEKVFDRMPNSLPIRWISGIDVASLEDRFDLDDITLEDIALQ